MSLFGSDAEVQSATLELFIYDGFLDQKWFNNGPKELCIVEGEWSQSDLTWENAPAFQETPLYENSQTTLWGWEQFDVTSHVQDIVSGSAENHGWFITHTTTSYGAFYRSSEYEEVEMRPKLTIEYSGSTSLKQSLESVTVSHDDVQSIAVLNLQGQVIESFGAVSRESVVASLPAGIYLLKIEGIEQTEIKRIRVGN